MSLLLQYLFKVLQKTEFINLFKIALREQFLVTKFKLIFIITLNQSPVSQC